MGGHGALSIVVRTLSPIAVVAGLVDGFAQVLAGLELDDSLFGDIDLVAGLRISTGSGRSFRYGESSETNQSQVVAFRQTIMNGRKGTVQDFFCGGFADISTFGDFRY